MVRSVNDVHRLLTPAALILAPHHQSADPPLLPLDNLVLPRDVRADLLLGLDLTLEREHAPRAQPRRAGVVRALVARVVRLVLARAGDRHCHVDWNGQAKGLDRCDLVEARRDTGGTD